MNGGSREEASSSRGWLLTASLAVLAACGARPLTATTGAAGGTSASGAAGTAAPGGAGAPGGSGGAGTGDSGSARCARTNDRAEITVAFIDGRVVSCATSSFDGGPGPMTFEGKIVSTGPNLIVVDSIAKIEIDAPGLDLSTIPHVFVRVELAFGDFYACQQSLEIVATNPPSNSFPGSAGQLLVAVSDGGAPFADSSYRVERVPLGCSTARGCGSPAPDDYAFDFSFADGGGAPLRAHMGEVVSLGSGAGVLTARDLRSYQSEACDDYWNFAYTILWTPTLIAP